MKLPITHRPQRAYIFGGLEAFILQGLIGGLLGAALVVKSYWRRIKAYFSGDSGEENASHPTDTDTPEK